MYFSWRHSACYGCVYPETARLIYRLARFCIRAAGWMCGVRVHVQGREKIAPGMTYVFLSNHQGNFDGPVLVHAIPRDWSALIKKEMMRLPVLSLVLKQVQFIPIERSNPQGGPCGDRVRREIAVCRQVFFGIPRRDQKQRRPPGRI